MTEETWNPPPKPAEFAETCLIDAILAGKFAIGSYLPAERELAAQLGVTRPTLREALQRLARDGWLEIHHGRPTRVRDYWQEGSLGVLVVIAGRDCAQPAGFIADLLAVRLLLAPTYARLAVERQPAALEGYLAGSAGLAPTPEALTAYDWELHHRLTVLSGNPIFTLILNGFRQLYQTMGVRYFRSPPARASSQAFYRELLAAVKERNSLQAEAITRRVMGDSLDLWQGVDDPPTGPERPVGR